MEKFLDQQRLELLRQGIPESDDEDWDGPHLPEETEHGFFQEEDNSLENEDLTYVTAILDSFSKPESNSEELNGSDYAIFTPEGAPTRATAKQMTPPNFNQHFNQNLTIKNSAAEKFSCFPTILEDKHSELADYSDEEEDDSLDNEDIWSESEEGENDFRFQSKLDTGEAEEDTALASIYCISQKNLQHLQHGDRIFLQNLSSEVHLLNPGGQTLHRWRPYHGSLPSPRSHQSRARIQQSDKLQYQ
jgi:hypothetical protein